MKTQLLYDLQESGSVPAAPPPMDAPRAAAPPTRPAVWHGPGARKAETEAGVDAPMQRADAGAMQRAPEAARGLGVAISAWAERAAREPSPQPEAPHQVSPPPAPAPEPAAPQPHAVPHPEQHADADRTVPRPDAPDTEPDWLAARLRADEALRPAPARTSVWKRRLVTWSIASGLLAGVVAAGLWLYEESRVEGALVAVANTAPAAPAPPPVADRGAQAFVAGSAAPAAPVRPAVAQEHVRPMPSTGEVAGTAAPAEAPAAVAAAAGINPVADAGDKVDKADTGAPERKRSVAKPRRVRPRDKAPAATVAAAPSARQRREETLLQCRAHGYDARQCIRRGCSTTRYGLVCRG